MLIKALLFSTALAWVSDRGRLRFEKYDGATFFDAVEWRPSSIMRAWHRRRAEPLFPGGGGLARYLFNK